MVVFSIKSFAQIGIGTPFNFCALSGTQYNPGYHPQEGTPYYDNRWVTSYQDALSESECVFLQTRFEDDYPGHTILAPPTMSYNCHGYSHSIFQGGDTCLISWYQELLGNCFVQVQTPLEGDIAVVRDYTDPSHTSFTLPSQHSSVVVNQDTLISKWGQGPLTKHHKDDVIGIPYLATGMAVYTYYRRIVNPNDSTHGPSIFNGTGTYTFTPNVTPTTCTWSVEPSAMFQTSSGSGYTANLSYATPFVYLAPKATITFTFSYSCDNHYTVTKEIDLRIPTTTISGVAVSDGFILDSNAVVTVTGKIMNNKDAKIIVPPGTRLVLENGTITSNGDFMWPGIEVWGNYFTHQALVNGSYGQGYLELKNGAVLENAICAVELWNPGHYGTTGGIVHATDATFLNNAMAVRAICYTNHDPSTNHEVGYNGHFFNCSFVVDTDYLGEVTFSKHAGLVDVNGLTFIGCDFSADRRVDGVDRWCMGIGAYEAGFSVNARCTSTELTPCPNAYLDRSTFTGLCTGIHAVASGSHPRTFLVRKSVFNHNDNGIYAENTGFPTILYNSFDIGGQDFCQFNYGVHLVNVTSFCIEENAFGVSSNPSSTTIGVAVYDSQGVNDVYRNDFKGLSCANLARGVNVMTSNGHTAPPGLTYSCNNNSDNQHDFRVYGNNGVGDIQSTQGSSSKPAGNTFGASGYHFYNDGQTPISYYYYNGDPDEIPLGTKLSGVTAYPTSSSNSCQTHYGGGGVVRSASEKKALEAEYLSARASYLDLTKLYESQVHGDSAVTPVLADLVAEIGVYAHDYSIAAGDIVRSDLNDSIADPTELRYWLGNMNDIAADRMAVASYLQEGDSASAFGLANALPVLYGLKGDDLADHNDYIRLVQLYQTLKSSKRNIFQLTETEMELVDGIAKNGSGVSKSMARVLEEEITGANRCACFDPGLPSRQGEGKDTPSYGVKPMNKSVGFAVEIIPNPATTWAVVNYTLPANMAKAEVCVTSMLGIAVMSFELEGNQGQKQLDFHGLAGGIYTYTVNCGTYQQTKKLVITK